MEAKHVNVSLHKAVEPIGWLVGVWVGEKGNGQFPTITSFGYKERIEFQSMGQPLLRYSAQSKHPESGTPMHSEAGFLRACPGTTKLAFMVAHNNGLTSLEEGEVATNNTISLKSVSISRMSFAKEPTVTKMERILTLIGVDKLEQVVHIETTNTPMTEHLRCIYTKLPSQPNKGDNQ